MIQALLLYAAVAVVGFLLFTVIPFILPIIGVILAIVVVVAIFGAVFGK